MLTDAEAKAAQAKDTTYRIADGASLYLIVRPTGAKSWEFRHKEKGKIRAVNLGRYYDKPDSRHVGIAAARKARDKARQKARDAADTTKPTKITVSAAADAWIDESRADWTAAHYEQVQQCFRDHINPIIGDMLVADVLPAHILEVIGALLAAGRVETARRARQRLSALFESATLKYKLVASPVAPTGRLISKRIQSARKANPSENFPCVQPSEQPALAAALRAYGGTETTRGLLQFVALTACRTGEARYATWDEFDLDNATWTIPVARLKGRDPKHGPHCVPLVPELVQLLRGLRSARPFVFPHPLRDDRPASENVLLYVLAELGYKGRMTGHGFRALFSTMANKSGLFRPDVIETALAHVERNPIRAAYNRNDADGKTYWAERVALAQWWAALWQEPARPVKPQRHARALAHT